MKLKARVCVRSYYEVELDSDDWGEDNFDEIDVAEALEDYEILPRHPDYADYDNPEVRVDGQWTSPTLSLKRDWNSHESLKSSFDYEVGGARYPTLNALLRAEVGGARYPTLNALLRAHAT